MRAVQSRSRAEVPFGREALGHPGLDASLQTGGGASSDQEQAAEAEHILPVLLTANEDDQLVVREDEEIPRHFLGSHPKRAGDVELDALPLVGRATVEHQDIVVPKPEVQLGTGDAKLHEGPPPRE
jgi:hypothetical protein